MPKQPPKRQPRKRTKKAISLTERIQHLADAWEREATTLGKFLETASTVDINHETGHNRAYYRFAGQLNGIGFSPKELREELSLTADDAQREAMLSDFRTELEAQRLAVDVYLEDNPDMEDITSKWEMEGKSIKLGHMEDGIADALKAHREQRKDED